MGRYDYIAILDFLKGHNCLGLQGLSLDGKGQFDFTLFDKGIARTVDRKGLGCGCARIVECTSIVSVSILDMQGTGHSVGATSGEVVPLDHILDRNRRVVRNGRGHGLVNRSGCL